MREDFMYGCHDLTLDYSRLLKKGMLYMDTYATAIDELPLEDPKIFGINKVLESKRLPTITYANAGIPNRFIHNHRSNTLNYFIGFPINGSMNEVLQGARKVLDTIDEELEHMEDNERMNSFQRGVQNNLGKEIPVSILKEKTNQPCDFCIHNRVCVDALVPQDNSKCPNYINGTAYSLNNGTGTDD